MARPVTVPTAFASEATYDAGSGVPAGLIGQPVRVAPSTAFYEFGFVPGGTFLSQYANWELGLTVDWVRWVTEGTSTMTKTAHLVETDSAGLVHLWGARLGDGSATGLNATEKLTIIGDGTQNAATITTVAQSLYALDIAAASTLRNGVRITQTGAGRNALEVVGNGNNAAAVFTGGAAGAITATSTAADAITGIATGGSLSGVRGVGTLGVSGEAGTTGGTGVRGDTMAGATSSSEGVLGAAVGDGVGVRATAVDGNAIVASATGDEDVVRILDSGDGASIYMAPKTAAPADQRAGQVYPLELDTDQAALMFCDNSTGVGPASDRYIVMSTQPFYAAANVGANANVAQNLSDQVLSTVVVGFSATPLMPDLVIDANVLIQPSPIGAMPKIAACTLEIWDATDSSTIATATVDVPADGVSRSSWVFSTEFSVPTDGSRTFQLRVSTAAGAGGQLTFVKPTIKLRTQSASVG